MAVVAETVRDQHGVSIGAANEVYAADAFGHVNVAGGAAALTALIGRQLRVKARFDKPGTLQRMSMALASPVDLDEAYKAGSQAVLYALEGESGCMVGFARRDGAPYRIDLLPVDLRVVANRQRVMPPEFLGDEPFQIASAFRAYALPLIGEPIAPFPRLLVRDGRAH